MYTPRARPLGVPGAAILGVPGAPGIKVGSPLGCHGTPLRASNLFSSHRRPSGLRHALLQRRMPSAVPT